MVTHFHKRQSKCLCLHDLKPGRVHNNFLLGSWEGTGGMTLTHTHTHTGIPFGAAFCHQYTVYDMYWQGIELLLSIEAMNMGYALYNQYSALLAYTDGYLFQPCLYWPPLFGFMVSLGGYSLFWLSLSQPLGCVCEWRESCTMYGLGRVWLYCTAVYHTHTQFGECMQCSVYTGVSRGMSVENSNCLRYRAAAYLLVPCLFCPWNGFVTQHDT